MSANPELRWRLAQAVRCVNSNDFRDMPAGSYNELLARLTKAPVVDESEIGGSRPFRAGKLSPRELDVVRALSHGMDNQMVADLYGLSRETVKSHVKRAMGKLAAKNRAHLVAVALRAGMID